MKITESEAHASKVELTKRIYAVFQGGGAKGVAHIGALSALEEPGISVRGVAGTSAGAIVAALRSAGYSADELLDEKNRKTILEKIEIRRFTQIGLVEYAKGPKDMFGPAGWLSIILLRNFARQWIPVSIFTLIIWSILFVYILSAWNSLVLGVLLILTISIGLILFLSTRGLASMDQFVRYLDHLLRMRVKTRNERRVTFSDMHAAGCPALKIVATNINTRALKVFSHETTPHVSVAEAVAASACLPVVFRPRVIEGHSYFDGGLISNLPAWVFDEEKALDSDALVIAIEIGDEEQVNDYPILGLSALIRAAYSAIFGTSSLEKRAISNLYSVYLKPEVGLLDFDMGFERAVQEVDLARELCIRDLIFRCIKIPAVMGKFCEIYSEAALDLINQLRRSRGLSEMVNMPRVSVISPPPNTFYTLSIKFRFGFDQAPDHAVSLPIASSHVGRCWTRKRSLFVQRGDADWGQTLSRPQDASVRRMILASLAWVIAIIYEPDEKDGRSFVIALDGEDDLGLPNDDRGEILETLSVGAQILINEFVPQEAFSHGN